MLVGTQFDQSPPNQRTRSQVEELPSLLYLLSLNLLLQVLGLAAREIRAHQVKPCGGRYLLPWNTVDSRERCAQRFVPLNKPIQRSAQGLLIQRSSQSGHELQVIGLVGPFNLID